MPPMAVFSPSEDAIQEIWEEKQNSLPSDK